MPEEVREAGSGDEYERALETLAGGVRAARGRRDGREAAPYALCLGYRIRYVLDLNAREAMHLIELRSGREGHPTYRAVAQAMHERIAAVHPAIAAAMIHVDGSREPRLERIMSEIRSSEAGPAEPSFGRWQAVGPGMRRVAGRMQTVGAGMLVLAVTVAVPSLSAAQQGAADPNAAARSAADDPGPAAYPRGRHPEDGSSGRRRGDPAGCRGGR